jgi:hypothetical protein
MQWSALTEGKQKNQFTQAEFRFIEIIRGEVGGEGRGGGGLLPVFRLHISIALQQKTANFKAAIGSRRMQSSALPERNLKKILAQTVFCIIKTTIIIIISAPSVTFRPSSPH